MISILKEYLEVIESIEQIPDTNPERYNQAIMLIFYY